MKRQRHKERGFVLVNALILVAAMAAASVWLLARAETARVRGLEAQDAAQAALYLDAFEALALTLLTRDIGSAADHWNEDWAKAVHNVALDRGRVAGRIVDLQGRFNVNWLSDPSAVKKHEAFLRLTKRLGISERKAGLIITFVTPGGPGGGGFYAQGALPIAPPGGPVLFIEQLALIPGIDPKDMARLSPHLAAIGGDSALNVNTTRVEVMGAMLSGTNPAALSRFLAGRKRDPFVSVEEFLVRLLDVLPEEEVAALDPQDFTVGSKWFSVSITAELGGKVRQRRTIMQRQPLPLGVEVAYRLDRVE